jgi:hypothetical protein
VIALSREIFGVELALSDFPMLKGVRGMQHGDPPELAQRLAEKFDYQYVLISGASRGCGESAA